DRDGDVKRWWSTLVRKKAADTVTGAPIQKSVAYASVTLGNSVSPDFRVPIIVYECCRFIREAGLRTEGIFRISGSERRIATKYPEFDTPPTYGLHTSWDGYTVHDVATILKKYLRDVPEPLFTNELFPYFLQTLDVSPDDAVRANYVQCLVCLLSPAHLVVVEFLFELLVDIARNADRTQMTTSNLARVLAPTVL
ncbi:Rho GTPase activation protein, partial [Hyaloraphidium curvatum]